MWIDFVIVSGDVTSRAGAKRFGTTAEMQAWLDRVNAAAAGTFELKVRGPVKGVDLDAPYPDERRPTPGSRYDI